MRSRILSVLSEKRPWHILPFDDVLAMAEVGVDAPFIRSLTAARLTALSATENMEMVEAGIDPKLIRAAPQH